MPVCAITVTTCWHPGYGAIPFQPADITPWILEWTAEHDGVEIYALYILMFVNCVTAVSVAGLIGRGPTKHTYKVVTAVCITVSCWYCAVIGFTPPMNTFSASPFLPVLRNSLIIMAVIFIIGMLLYYLQRRSPRWAAVAVALLLVPVCFIATDSILWDDYTYIFAPALRLPEGTAVRNIYFQYDLLPSLLAAGWMKLGLDLNVFQVLGQAGYYTTIMGIFLFSEKLFLERQLSLFLVAALVLGRIYASPWDAVICFQVTPLRLDLWPALVAAVFYLGPFHWAAGLVCGLLLLLLKTFGIIYSLAYLQLLLTLFAINCYDRENKIPLGHSLLEYIKRCRLPLIIIATCGCASYLLFSNNEYGDYTGYYQKLGIGFIQISSVSFYWYVPALLSMVFILLFRLRKLVSSPYLASGLLLTYCAIGNSIYFFGRSHEHNIINISIVLLFVFFLMLDLTTRFLNADSGRRELSSFCRRHAVSAVAITFIAVIILSYSQNISHKAGTQIRNIGTTQLIYPSNINAVALQKEIDAIRSVTSNSTKVYFIGGSDFNFYYYGGYTPVGYCNPFLTWIFAADLNRFLQSLLDNGYYLVCRAEMKYLPANLHYTSSTDLGNSLVVTKFAPQKSNP